ncbi:MAG TPA: S8 family serine peptidase [Jatrophihabitantaceae bacterium]|nr:S8 family serine peptidase [Jatrophihabitantaceae bacterium]
MQRRRARAVRLTAAAAALFVTSGAAVALSTGAASLPPGPVATHTAPMMLRQPATKPAHATVAPGYSRTRIVVKLAEGSAVTLRGQRMLTSRSADTIGFDSALARVPGAALTPLFSTAPSVLRRQTRALEAKSHRELADLSLYYRVTVPRGTHLAAFIDSLNALPIVEIAEAEPLPRPVPASPNLEPDQGYRTAAPNGIDADFAATVAGGTGANVTIADVEYSWNKAHEDLSKASAPGATLANGTPVDPFHDNNHGTAVIGEMIADDNSSGVTGLVPDATLRMVNADNTSGYDLANAIDLARQNLSPGDVILIEQQIAGPGGNCGEDQVGCVPVEWFQAYYDAIMAATAKGIIVVETAGNGSQNLNNAMYGRPFPQGRPDSGAILVGAANAPDCSTYAGDQHSRLFFSNYGSRVNVQGWGECVVTTGYGDDFGSGNAAYTNSFSGTSSAGPMVASAAAAVSSAYQQSMGTYLDSTQVRQILTSTGTPQAGSEHIGPLPDLSAALTDAPPPNDDFAQATVLTGESVTRSDDTNVLATREPGEPKHDGVRGGASVWYRWTAPATGTARINTAGSDFNTVLAVYRGTAVNALTDVTANNDAPGDVHTSAVAFHVKTGTTYQITVDGYAKNTTIPPDGGVVHLRLAETVPPKVTALQPAFGPVGMYVTIVGTGLSGLTSVKFGSVAATFTQVSATEIIAAVPAGATDHAITLARGSSSGTSASAFDVTNGKVVTATGGAFTPQKVTIKVGQVVGFDNKDTAAHSVVDALSLGTGASPSFDSGALTRRGSFALRRQTAGRFDYASDQGESTAMSGIIDVLPSVSKTHGGTSTSFHLVWATHRPAGCTFDVLVAHRSPKGSYGSYKPFLQSTTAKSTHFVANHGRGNYAFIARLVRTATGRTSGYSGARVITVS